MRLTEARVLTVELNGKRLVYAVPKDGRDPMEMTLGEWQACPVLSSVAITADFFARRAALARESDE